MRADKPSAAAVIVPLLVWPLALAALGALLAHGAKPSVLKPLTLGCLEFGVVIGVMHLLVVRLVRWRREIVASVSRR